MSSTSQQPLRVGGKGLFQFDLYNEVALSVFNPFIDSAE